MILEARGEPQLRQYRLKSVPTPMIELFRAEVHEARKNHPLMDPFTLGAWATGGALGRRAMDRIDAAVFQHSNRFELVTNTGGGIIPITDQFLHSDFVQRVLQQSGTLSTEIPLLEVGYMLEKNDNQVVSANIGNVSLYYGLNSERSFQVNARSNVSLQDSLEAELNTRQDGVPYSTTPKFYFSMLMGQFRSIGRTPYSDRVRHATIRFDGEHPHAEFDVFVPSKPEMQSTLRYHILE